MVNIILDFDGTITDAGEESKPYILYHAEEFSKRTNVTLYKVNTLRKIIKKEVLKNPIDGWLCRNKIMASASADAYILESTIYRRIIEKLQEEVVDYNFPENTDNFLSELFHICSAKVKDVFRPNAKEFLDYLVDNHNVVIVTNSKEDKVYKKLERLTEEENKIHVYGNAKKYNPEDELDGIPESIHPEEFPRPVFLRRGEYYRVLKKVEEEKGFKPENTVVIGDIYELDLSLPQYLGYKVALLETEFTPEYEKRFLRKTKNSYVAKDFTELIDIIKNKNS